MIKSPAVTDDKKNLTDHKVILGLSGGVDSAVAAILLQERGADVQALHMTNWEDDDGYCTAAADLQDARNICEQLKIPLHHVNFSSQYRDQVFNNFLAEYKAGRTPNPDVLCNREIKFGVFREHAKRLGGDLIATGHYAQSRTDDGHVSLYKAQDRSKDQSYFLHAVRSQALAESVFPLGNVQKTTVRNIAREHGLSVHDKKDSTGICFIGERPFREFLASFLPASPGPMKTPDGIVVGEHQGLMYYTLGQRQGLGIGGLKEASDEPWYVAGKDLASNALLVVQGDHPLLYSGSLEAAEPHWIGPVPEVLAAGQVLDCAVKIRYRQDDQPCSVTAIGENRLDVTFATPQAAVTPGQFAVFYAADRCLGGAVIDLTGIAETAKDALRKTG